MLGTCGTPAAEFGLFRNEIEGKELELGHMEAKEGTLPVYESEMRVPENAVIRGGEVEKFGRLGGVL